MKKINKVIIFLFFVVVAQIFSYQYYKNIKNSGNLKYKQFYITEDIYENSKNNLNDIRIIDKNGENVPFVIENEESQKKQTEKIVAREKKFEKVVKKDNIEYIVKFNSQNPNEDLVANQILLVAKKNFYTEYKLFGSNNSTSWEEIKSGEIFKTPESEKLLVEFEKKRYEYYKIVVKKDASDIFDEAILKNYDKSKTDLKMNETNLNFEVEEKDKVTILKIKSKKLPLKSVVLDVEDAEFKRYYAVTDGVKYFESGNISKFSGSKNNLEISVEDITPEELIIIEIQNEDNKPLKIKDVKGKYIPEKVVFQDNGNGEYKITFGDEYLEKLNFDLEQFSDMIKERDFVELGKLNKVENVEKEKPKDYSVYYNIFIGIVVILLVLFMARKIGKKR